MPDITMCKDKTCPNRETCYRFTAKPSERQSYFIVNPRTATGCEWFWERGEAMHVMPEVKVTP